MTHVDELVQRGRGQGHLSLPELRAAFGRAGISATEATSILRELSEAGVQLGNDPERPAAGRTPNAAAGAEADGADQAAAEASAAAAAQSAAAEVDLEQAGLPAAAMQLTQYRAGVQRDQRRRQLGAVNDGGHPARPPSRTRRPLTGSRACLGLDRNSVGHGSLLQMAKRRPPGVPARRAV